MKSRILVLFFLFLQAVVYGQYKISGVVVSDDNRPINKVQIYNESGGLLGQTGILGKFNFSSEKQALKLIFYVEEYRLKNVFIELKDFVNLKVTLETFAGKKTEVILVNQSTANLAANNARQIFNQIAGLNIFQNDDAGLQLNIGGRGLDPNRTANFNTRQNGYDISADVLGYPESYYTPASEGLDEIQIVRGAASLQYGTQFGGLINFITKKPSAKPLEVITRNTVGSFGLFSNFTSFSGTKGSFSYYSYINYKKGNGFRPNSNFDSKNVFGHLAYKPNEKDVLSLEVTYLDYLAKQAGGLTDKTFNGCINFRIKRIFLLIYLA